MSFNVTNQIASQANVGESVTITLNQTDVVNNLPNIALGSKVTISSSSKVGYVTWVDSKGTQFTASPKLPTLTLASNSTPNILSASETITIG